MIHPRKVADAQSKGVVIGISGGIDSAVVALLSARALDKGKVVEVLLPSHTTPDENYLDAMQVVKLLSIEHERFPISNIIETYGKLLPDFRKGGRHEVAIIRAA